MVSQVMIQLIDAISAVILLTMLPIMYRMGSELKTSVQAIIAQQKVIAELKHAVDELHANSDETDEAQRLSEREFALDAVTGLAENLERTRREISKFGDRVSECETTNSQMTRRLRELNLAVAGAQGGLDGEDEEDRRAARQSPVWHRTASGQILPQRPVGEPEDALQPVARHPVVRHPGEDDHAAAQVTRPLREDGHSVTPVTRRPNGLPGEGDHYVISGDRNMHRDSDAYSRDAVTDYSALAGENDRDLPGRNDARSPLPPAYETIGQEAGGREDGPDGESPIADVFHLDRATANRKARRRAAVAPGKLRARVKPVRGENGAALFRSVNLSRRDS